MSAYYVCDVAPISMFRENRQKLCAKLRKHRDVVRWFKHKPKMEKGRRIHQSNDIYVLMEGGKTVPFNDTDTEYLFRQESYFQYLFGVNEADCFGVINVATDEATLFIPKRFPDSHPQTWRHKREFRCRYQKERVCYVDELETFFANAAPLLILTLSGINTDSGVGSQPARFVGIEKFVVDCDLLYPVLAECRVIKSPEELRALRYVAKVSSDAHIRVMQYVRPGRMEFQCESLFLHHVYAEGGCRHTSFKCICAGDMDSYELQYGHADAPNDRSIQQKSMCLFNMGANFRGYATDISCSFPATGKFNDDQKFIYNAVLDARNAVLQEAREGVSWVAMHKLAARVLLQRLKEGGILKGEVNEMLNAGLAGVFQPHGLGHLIGLDVHDVGGYLPGQPERPTESWLSQLRFARKLKAGMYLTVEPGCYFDESQRARFMNDPTLSRFVDWNLYYRFERIGGVRIGDCVLITKQGNEVFSLVPRTVEQIEKVMAEGNQQ